MRGAAVHDELRGSDRHAHGTLLAEGRMHFGPAERQERRCSHGIRPGTRLPPPEARATAPTGNVVGRVERCEGQCQAGQFAAIAGNPRDPLGEVFTAAMNQ